MRGKLNLFQATMLRWKELHPYSAVHVARVDASLDPARLGAAIARELEVRGLTHLVLDAAGGRFDYGGGPAPVVPAILSAGGDRRKTLDAEIARQLNQPFPADGAVDPFRFFAIRGDASFDLAVAYDHFIAGGDSIVLLLQAIVARYLHGDLDPQPAVPGLYPRTFRPLLLHHAFAVLRGLVSLPRLAMNCRHSHRPRYLRWPDPTNGFVSFSLEQGEFASMLSAAKAWDVTLNDMLIAVMMKTLSPLAEKRLTARRRVFLAAASIMNIRSDVGADVREWFGQFLSSFRVAHRVPEGIGLRELAQDVCAQTREWKKRKLYLQTLVVMFYSSIVWHFLGVPQRQRFHVKNWPVWVGVTMLNVDALWREGGTGDPPPEYLRAVSTGPLAPMVVAVSTSGGRFEAGISYRTGAFEEATVLRIADRVRDALRNVDRPDGVVTVE
ncbi:MAG TPA: hypothetical protein PLW68_03835 [Casimicrobiaceae bacterium]|nr:hypothetical protein [Casimicrobiaceae bacterium]